MHQLLPILAAAALASLHGVLASSRPLVDGIDNIDNEIPVNDPIPFEGRKLFVSIENGPTTAHHRVGSATELSCEAMGHPAPHIQWLKNDMPILEDELENNEIIDESTSSLAMVHSTLIIVAMSPNKEDLYTCVARSGAKTAMASATVYYDHDSIPSMLSSLSNLNRHLLSAPQKPRIIQYAKTYMGDVNTNLVLPCHVTGNPMPEIQWHDKYNNRIVDSEGRIRVLESGELVFTPALWGDMGNFVCTAVNAFGKDSVTTFMYPVVTDKIKYNFNRSHRPH